MLAARAASFSLLSRALRPRALGATPADIARRAAAATQQPQPAKRRRRRRKAAPANPPPAAEPHSQTRTRPAPSAPARTATRASAHAAQAAQVAGQPLITVVGVGGAGGNAVSNMIAAQMPGVTFAVVNTDAQALSESLAVNRVQVGASGLGAGADPELGRAAAEEDIDAVLEAITPANMVFVTGGMGGGTCTGAAPVIAQAAREAGILTVGVVSTPFGFEGTKRNRVAAEGLQQLAASVDTLIVVPNERLLLDVAPDVTFKDALARVDAVLFEGVKSVTDLIVKPGLINLDFADVRAVMHDAGRAVMGAGEGVGDHRAVAAVTQALTNPLLGDFDLGQASGLLVTIAGGADLSLLEVDSVMQHVRAKLPEDANVIFGSTFDDSLRGRVRVSVIVSGVEDRSSAGRPSLSSAAGTAAGGAAAGAGAAEDAEDVDGESKTPRMAPATPPAEAQKGGFFSQFFS